MGALCLPPPDARHMRFACTGGAQGNRNPAIADLLIERGADGTSTVDHRVFESVTTEARAGAEAIRPVNEQLEHSPRYIELARAKRWNGVLPTTILSQTLGLNPLACSPY